ncbi:MAG TPA: CHASE domain-containing protein [Bryobacteraceae bacterium]
MPKPFFNQVWPNSPKTLPEHDEFFASPLRRAPYWLVASLLVLIHIGSSWLGYLLISGGSQVTPVFPEAGLDLVTVLVFGPRYWPVLLACYFGTSLWRHVAWAPSLGIAAVTLTRTLTAAWIFRRASAFRKVLGEFSDLTAVSLASVIPPALAAAAGTPFLVLGGRFPLSQWAAVFGRWWIADALGTLAVAPLLIVLVRACANGRQRCEFIHLLKLAVYIGGSALACYFVFFRFDTGGLLFSVFGLILVAAAWLGPGAASASAFVIAGGAIWATHVGLGPFVGGTMRENLQNLDLFVAAISLTGVAVGAFRASASLLVPGSVLLAGWALSGWLYASLDRDRANYDEARFDKMIGSVETRIGGRFETYEDVLWGAAGLLAASQRISPRDWHVYVDRLRLLNRYPETTAIAVVQPVRHQELDGFVRAHRRGEWPGFKAHQFNAWAEASADSPEHFLVVCVEPATVAARAIGADLTGDPVRRVAAEQARDFGGAALTSSTVLGNGLARGVQLFVPVYREGAGLNTIADRRRALIAWVSVVFRADTFFSTALAELDGELGLRVYDGDRAASGHLFFPTSAPGGRPPRSERTTHLTLGGNTWTLAWSRLPGFPYVSRTPSAWAAGCTAMLSLFLACLVLSLQSTRRRAAALAAEQTVKISQLATIVESADAAIISTDPARNTVLTWNRGAERIYGYSAEEMIGRSISLLVPEDRLAELDTIMDRLRRGEAVNHFETTRLTKTGELIYVLLTISPIRDSRGIFLGIASIAWDVTPIKELERQLAQAQKLESIGELAAGIAHEINTPIQYIGDNASFLDEAFRDLLNLVEARQNAGVGSSNGAHPDSLLATPRSMEEGVLIYLRREVPKAIGQLIEGINQVARIVRAMKEFSHPGTVEKSPTDINRAIESTILVSKNEWKYVSEVTTDLDRDLPPVPCVAGEFNQVILNLIVNAAHAISDVVSGSGRKGRIHITTRRLDVGVEIRISDTGTGIPQTIRSKVFDPFFTTKPVGKGTGQGLAIAHSVIVQKHNGVLTFESESGRGTTFIIQLPLVCELETA